MYRRDLKKNVKIIFNGEELFLKIIKFYSLEIKFGKNCKFHI